MKSDAADRVGWEVSGDRTGVRARERAEARRPGGRVRLTRDDEVRRVVHEVTAAPLGLDGADAGYQIAIAPIDTQVLAGQVARQAGDAGRLHHSRLQGELR
jgi:hypothetical protein